MNHGASTQSPPKTKSQVRRNNSATPVLMVSALFIYFSSSSFLILIIFLCPLYMLFKNIIYLVIYIFFKTWFLVRWSVEPARALK